MQKINDTARTVKEKASLVKQAIDFSMETSSGEHWEATRIGVIKAYETHKDLLASLEDHYGAIREKAASAPKIVDKGVKPTKNK